MSDVRKCLEQQAACRAHREASREDRPLRRETHGTYHYPLLPREIYRIAGRTPQGQVDVRRVGSVSQDVRFHIFRPNQYLLVQIDEHIEMPDGLVAQFVSPYQIIEKGFSLNSGRMESPFGREGNRLVFGVHNLLEVENAFSYEEPVAYVYFFDLRGLDNKKIALGDQEEGRMKAFGRRYKRASDDGVYYDKEE